MRVGIALGGGGAKGLAHVGVLRVLQSAQVPIDIVTGTSAGAIVGALYAAGKSPDEIEQLARRLHLRQWLARDRTGMGLFSTDGIRRILEGAIGKGVRIQDLPRGFAAVAVDLDSQQEVIFDSGPVTDAVCASVAFPLILAPVRIDGHYFLDGGLLNPVPFDAARRLGADRVIAVDLAADEPLFTTAVLHHRPSRLLFQLIFTAQNQWLFRISARSIGIMTKQLRLWKMAQAPPDLVIYPSVSDVGLFDFDLIGVCLAAGESAAREALPRIRPLITPPRWARLLAGWHWLTMRLRHALAHP